MTTHQPIQRRKLFHEVQDRLVQRIRSGEFAAGDHLPAERELMTQYGVGRPAVREALQTMARSGIVEIMQGERARVLLPTADALISQIADGAQHLLRMQPSNLDHLKEARVFLEAGLARIAATRATPDDVTRLRQRLRDHRAALVKLDQFLACDMAFHREIAAISGNPIFPAIVEALFHWASEYYQSIVRAPGAEHLTLIEHQRIIDTIAAGDAAGTERAMRDHLMRANAMYRNGAAEASPG